MRNVQMLDENGANVYNEVREMLSDSFSNIFTYLDSYIGNTQREEAMLHRQRVKMADGSYRWVQGKTHDELNDAIVRAYVESGRIAEFMDISPKGSLIQTNFKELGERWFTTYKTGLKETSKRDYRYVLESLLYPVFQDAIVQNIKLTDIQEFLNTHPNTAKSTLVKTVIVLDQLFNLAIRDGLMEKNPIDKKLLKYPSNKVKEKDALTIEEFEEVVAGIPNLTKQDDKRLLALFCFTGMRRGEVAGLRWEDIDFDAKLIHVNRNVIYPENNPIISTPKTKKGYRTIPLDERLLQYLLPAQDEGFVLGGEKPYKKSKFDSVWKRIGEIIDLHGARFHVFRHTYATLLNNAGVDYKTIQSIMGHANITTTMNIYTHTHDENIVAAGTKFAALTRTASAQVV